mmetsp:Transcript_11399/g.18552  ORF Transcript_11399/g.18552 Transcript_11399/m.18552 type:complete len:200 (+) Transcript_11399:356-955(+)
MRGHYSPAISLRKCHSIDGLGHGPNLVHLQEQGITRFLPHRLLDAGRVGHQQIITNHLDSLTHSRGKGSIIIPVILIKRILNGHNRILLRQVRVKLSKSSARQNILLAVRTSSLERKVVLSIRGQELRGSNVHTNLHFFLIACLLNGLHEKINTLVIRSNIRSKATLISDIASILTVLLLNDILQGSISLTAHDHSLCE